MALDEALAQSVRNGSSTPVLRIYGWTSPALSLGAFQKLDGIDTGYCKRMLIPVVRRLTGGRAILHGDELTYSFSAGNNDFFSGSLMNSYLMLGAVFHLCFRRLGLVCMIRDNLKNTVSSGRSPLCFESTSLGEISHAGLKLVGSAQKRWKDAFLQQGTIPYSVDFEKLSGVFGMPPGANAQEKDSGPNSGLRKFLPDLNPEILKTYLLSAFEEIFSVSLLGSLPSPEELLLADRLISERYLDQSWTMGEKADTRSCNKTEKLTPGL
jgi:lipoate-protein ligase A